MTDDTVTTNVAEPAALRLAADRYDLIWQRVVRRQGDSMSSSGFRFSFQEGHTDR